MKLEMITKELVSEEQQLSTFKLLQKRPFMDIDKHHPLS